MSSQLRLSGSFFVDNIFADSNKNMKSTKIFYMLLIHHGSEHTPSFT